jgi:hypothetical protein
MCLCPNLDRGHEFRLDLTALEGVPIQAGEKRMRAHCKASAMMREKSERVEGQNTFCNIIFRSETALDSRV